MSASCVKPPGKRKGFVMNGLNIKTALVLFDGSDPVPD